MSFFELNDYRELITLQLEQKIGRGAKAQVAEVLNCNPGYISQVLNKSKIHFSPENIIKVASFLKLNSVEEEFLLALFYLERAGSKELEKFWQNKVSQLRKQHLKVESQVKNLSQELSESAQATYYSHWAYSAIHMVVSIYSFKTSEEIAARLKISEALAAKIVQFLEKNNLITKDKTHYKIGKTRIHLKSQSPLVKAHHQNFRNKAITSLEEENDFDLHYSGVLTLSKKDAVKVRQLLLKFLSDKEEILIPSANEEIVALNFDLFKF